MPSKDDLTPSESAILVVLLAEAREISNKELQDQFGFTLTGKSREKLNALGLVTSWKVSQTYWHRLGDGGWDRFQKPLNFDGAKPRAFGAALGSLLEAVRRDLERNGRSLAMAFAPDLAGPKPWPRPATDLTARIREAYHAMARGPRAWVSIADIRRKFGDVSRGELDAALRDLERAPDVNIVPESNQKALTDEERRAAVTIGDQAKHFLAIGV
jgi:hypothetical protein